VVICSKLLCTFHGVLLVFCQSSSPQGSLRGDFSLGQKPASFAPPAPALDLFLPRDRRRKLTQSALAQRSATLRHLVRDGSVIWISGASSRAQDLPSFVRALPARRAPHKWLTVPFRNRSSWLSESSPLGALFSPIEYGTQLPYRQLRNARPLRLLRRQKQNLFLNIGCQIQQVRYLGDTRT
jgi:hypothetical protein